MKINIINDNIEFVRKLEDGDGDKLYGINICRYLKMPNEFLLKAEEIKKTLTNTNHNYVDFKRSNYNSKYIWIIVWFVILIKQLKHIILFINLLIIVIIKIK